MHVIYLLVWMVAAPPVERTLMRHRDQILWDNANEPLVWAVDIGDKEKRNRYDHWQNHKNEHARSTLAITKQQVGEDRGHSH